MSAAPDSARQQGSFSKLERVKRDEAKRQFLATTPGERVENALRLSELATEMRAGLRPQR